MALCGIGVNSNLDGIELRFLSSTSSIKAPIKAPLATPFRNRCFRLRCRAYANAVSSMESEDSGHFVAEDMELGPVTRFRTDDFDVSDRVSVGLGGKVMFIIACIHPQFGPCSSINNDLHLCRPMKSFLRLL